jgi:hypothetical protein
MSDRLRPPGCGASSIAATGGPTAVPFRLCCAHSIIQAGGGRPAGVQCAALAAGAATPLAETWRVPTAARTAP